MKISAVSNNNISFQKTLAARVNVLKNNEPYPCKIYKLDKTDKDYFEGLLSSQNNNFPYFLYILNDEFRGFCNDDMLYDATDFFVLEDKKSRCLGFLETSKMENGEKNIDYLEIAKNCADSNSIRHVKYVGETMVAFLAKLIQNTNSKSPYVVGFTIPSARDFYTDNCGFIENNSDNDDIFIPELILPEEKMNDLIAQNEGHTKGKIELVR